MTPIERALHLADRRQFAAALATLARAAAGAGRDIAFGRVLRQAGRIDAAIDRLHAALRQDGAAAETLYQLGLCWLEQEQPDLAAAYLAQAERFGSASETSGIALDRALALLQAGRLTEGFAAYEARRARFPADYPDLGVPLWTGEELAGRTLLVRDEQGIGDTIMLARYLPLLRDLGAQLVFAVRQERHALVAGAPWLYDPSLDRRPYTHGADYGVWLGSLPHLFATTLGTIPAPASPFAWAPRCRPGPRRIGLVWAGNSGHGHDQRRSMVLESLLPLAGLSDVTLHALQLGLRQGDIALAGAEQLVEDLAPGLTNWRATAEALATLDLVVTVDTAVAHFAASMGMPVAILLARAPDWRWLLERRDSPWYPSVRLYRQRATGDWDPVIAAVAQDIEAGRL